MKMKTTMKTRETGTRSGLGDRWRCTEHCVPFLFIAFLTLMDTENWSYG